MKNLSNMDNSSTKSPYQQINLQVLSPSNPVPKNDVQNKEQKDLKILIEKRYKGIQTKEVNELIVDTIQSVVKLITTGKKV